MSICDAARGQLLVDPVGGIDRREILREHARLHAVRLGQLTRQRGELVRISRHQDQIGATLPREGVRVLRRSHPRPR